MLSSTQQAPQCLELFHSGKVWPLSQALCHKPVTQSWAVQVPWREPWKAPLSALPGEGKPSWTLQSNDNGEKAFAR